MSEKELKVSDIKFMTPEEKDEILCDAIHKTVLNVSLEYDITIPQMVGCVDIVKSELKAQYFAKRFKE